MGWEKRRAEWVAVAWLAIRVHVGRIQSGGGFDVIDVKEDQNPPPPRLPAPGSRSPPPPPPQPTQVRPPPRPRIQAPPRSGGHVSGRGGMWLNGWSSSNSNSTRRGRSARSARRPRSTTSRRALLRRPKRGGWLKWSVTPFAATRSASRPR